MGKATHRTSSVAMGLLAVLGVAIGWGCSGQVYTWSQYDFFGAPDRDDPWSEKIEYWQARERADRRSGVTPRSQASGAAAVVGAGTSGEPVAQVESLEAKYAAFRRNSKRAMARRMAEWIQEQSRQHYIPDEVVDDWATLDATLRNNGDDCDGLELLVLNGLRDLGFDRSEVYRAIVYRRSDGQHHMVTLWFEETDDPWVIDPTGAMTSGMPRMSDLPEWTPIKVFSEDEEYTVRSERFAHSAP